MSSDFGALVPTSTESIIITSVLVLGLVIAATKANILDKNGIIAAALLGLIVGGLGGWYWLLTLLIFLLTSHKVTKYRFAEKKELGMSESDDGHRGWQNVVANGGLAGLVSIISFLFGSQDLGSGYVVFACAVSVAAAGTTEGTLYVTAVDGDPDATPPTEDSLTLTMTPADGEDTLSQEITLE